MRIALLLDYFYVATFQQEVVEGLSTAIAGRNIELFVFLGGPFLRDPYNPFVTARNSVYNLITREMFDGMIVCNSVTNFIASDQVVRVLERFQGLPIVFLGNGPDQFPRVTVDNVSGMGSVIRHFINVHGAKRIAFITGPEENREADERLQGYRRELEAAGLPFDPALVAPGDFSIKKGVEAVRVLLDDRHAEFDALVVSNDFMALGAKMELERRGYAIPGDVALAGFDDSLEAACVLPSLTTVHQPYEAIASAVLDELSDLHQGRTVPGARTVPAELVVRQSCGCFPRISLYAAPAYDDSHAADPAAYFRMARSGMVERLEELFAPFGFPSGRSGIAGLVDAFFTAITGMDDARLFPLLQQQIAAGVSKDVNVEIWQEAVSLLGSAFAPVSARAEDPARAEQLFQRARVLISHIQHIQKNQHLLLNWKQTDQLSEVGRTLFTAVESSEWEEVIYNTFPLLNIRNFLFVEFVSCGDEAEMARLVALILDDHPVRRSEEALFPPTRLFPRGTNGFGVSVSFVLPVTYQDKSLGFVVYEKIERLKPLFLAARDDPSGSFYYEKIKGLKPIYTALTRELANSFYINRLIAMRKESERSLQALTEDLELRNRELEDFAHIASHDLQEPLRKIVVFGERLRDAAVNGDNTRTVDFIERMNHATGRMKDLIDGLLAYSQVANQRRPVTRVDLFAVVEEVLHDLEGRLHETNGIITCGALPTVVANPLHMRELFQNLLGNALKYHRPGVPPLVEIRVTAEDGFYVISVSDNGMGFDPAYSEKIFKVFQRLVGKKEYKGTGIGLAICKKIVERSGGTIGASGDPGHGAVFTIRLPVDNGD